MTISTKFSKLVGDTSHLELQTSCLEFIDTAEFLSLNTKHKGVVRSTLNKTSQRFLEKLLGVTMPVGHRYEIKKHCDNPNCCNPYHMTFELRQSKHKGISDAQKALWADEEHRADRVNKIKNKHLSAENRLVHSWVYKKMHENNYDVILADDTVVTNLNRSDAKDYILAGANFVNRKILYITHEQLQQNKKFSVMGIKGKNGVREHLANGWQIGYSSTYETVPTSTEYQFDEVEVLDQF